jgi:hypothetical protein
MTIKGGVSASATEVITSFGRVMARQCYQANISDATSDEYFKTEKYTTASGDTGTTASWNSVDNAYTLGITDQASGDTTHDPDSMTNVSNVFDGDDSTYASKSSVSGNGDAIEVGKTFTSKNISWVRAKYFGVGNGTGGASQSKLQSYNGSTWSDVAGTTFTGENNAIYARVYYVNLTGVQGIRLVVTTFNSSGDGYTVNVYAVQYGNAISPSVVKENAVFSKNPDSIVVYASKSTPTNTTITMDISDNGGSSYALTNKPFDTYIDTTSLSGSTIALRFNLSTTDTAVTPKLYGWSAVIMDT